MHAAEFTYVHGVNAPSRKMLPQHAAIPPADATMAMRSGTVEAVRSQVQPSLFDAQKGDRGP